MRRKYFLLPVLLFVSFVASNLSTSSAYADRLYIRRTFTRDGWCNKTGFLIHGTFSWSVPSGEVYAHSIARINGRVYVDGTFLSGLSGMGATEAQLFSSPGGPFPQVVPYTYSLDQDWYTKSGGIFTHTRTRLRCNTPNSVPEVTETYTP
jgi:hypothetical protein